MFVAAYRNTENGIVHKAGLTAGEIISNANAKAARIAAGIIATAHDKAEQIIAEAVEKAARILSPDNDEVVPVPNLIRFVAEKHGVPYSAVTGCSRSEVIVEIRHEAMALVYSRRPDLSLPQIGKFFGGKDHTTILHAVRKLGVHRTPHQERQQP